VARPDLIIVSSRRLGATSGDPAKQVRHMVAARNLGPRMNPITSRFKYYPHGKSLKYQ
jgi:hypothetical protein